MQNEIQKLRRLLDLDRKAVKAYKEQEQRVNMEHETRLIQIDAEIMKLEASIETWENLIKMMEEQRES